MNQILETNLNRNKKIKKLLELKNVLRLQLIFSIVLIIFIGAFLIYNTFKLYKQEHYSSKVLDNYNITRLYSGLSSNTIENSDEDISNSVVIGIIEIPKINKLSLLLRHLLNKVSLLSTSGFNVIFVVRPSSGDLYKTIIINVIVTNRRITDKRIRNTESL